LLANKYSLLFLALSSCFNASVTAKTYAVVGLGELLWDVFPEGNQLGGAPANFAYMTNLLGDAGVVASRVGDDDLGRAATQRLERLRLRTSSVQLDPIHPTGVVKVDVDPSGQPTFHIAQDVAWDFFEWTPAWRSLAESADAVFFDVNLRQSFYSAPVLEESSQLADIIKVNHDELPVVAKLLGLPFIYDEMRAAQWLRAKYNSKLVCITRGAKGSLVVSETETSEHPGYRVHVADTVGAGDAFTAALVYHFLRHASVSTLNEAANRMGAWVASQTGATPAPDEFRLEKVRSAVGAEEF
jgi:fructokinase